MRREEAAALCCVLPLLLAKQRRLDELEKELVDEGVSMQDAPKEGSDDDAEGDEGDQGS